jgi:hypothetical protein
MSTPKKVITISLSLARPEVLEVEIDSPSQTDLDVFEVDCSKGILGINDFSEISQMIATRMIDVGSTLIG